MQKIITFLIFILALIVSTGSYAQGTLVARRNDNAATVQILTNGQLGALAATSAGKLFIASDYVEDAVAASGDIVNASGSVIQATPASSAADGDWTYNKTDALSKLWTAGDQIEDVAHVSGDRGSFVLGVADTAATTGFAASGDYIPFSASTNGWQRFSLLHDGNIAQTLSATAPEDSGIAAAAALVKVGFITQDPLGIDQDTNNDWAFGKLDRAGRMVTTLAPASERWSACSVSNTGTSDVAIKALVASNKICATSLSCFNTATVASSISFRSTATEIYAGGVGNSTLNGVAVYQTVLPVPICTAVGAPFNFAMGTNLTATTCCGSGFITTN